MRKQGSEYLSDAAGPAAGRRRWKRYSDPCFAVALAGFVLTLAAFWPGYLSWDSAYQWWQARTGTLDPAHPPVMVRVWQLARLGLPDPGGMLVLQAALWWSALALFARALGGGALRRAGTVVLLGAWPPLLALLPHLWKDVWMSALFAAAVACLAADVRAPRQAWRIGALAAIAGACAFRVNALPAALPLLAWLAWRVVAAPPKVRGAPGDVQPPAAGVATSPRRRGIATLAVAAALVAAVVAAGALANRAPGRDMRLWPTLALWDLAAVSIAEDRLLFPPDWVDPTLTVGDLRRDFVPYVNVPSFERGQLKLDWWYAYTPAQYAALRDAWLALPRDHARAYLAHRATVSAYLLGLRQDAHPDHLVISPAIVAFKDNPPLAPPSGAVHAVVQPALSRLVDTPVFAPWSYLVVAAAIVLAALGWRHGPRHRELAGAVAASSLLLAAPLLLVAPSSDFRYLLWSVFAAMLAAALWFAPAGGEEAEVVERRN
jgi:hypothetical protein